MKLTVGVCICYMAACLWFFLEKQACGRARKQLRHVIHVGGIRGKTSVCRMLDAVLRQQYAVVTKTTGTAPRIIGVDGVDRPLRRIGPANIREQIRLLLHAGRTDAEVLIAECMAVAPDLQTVSQRDILKGDIVIITNVRHDHMFELGETLDEIAESLCAVLPENGTVFTADAHYFPLFEERCRQRNSRAVFCPVGGDGDENAAIVRQVAAFIGLDSASAADGLSNVQQDFGVSRLYRMKNGEGEEIFFLNLFSVNDPQSTLHQLNRYRKADQAVYFLYNSRGDRPDRLLLFIRHFFPAANGAGIFLMGDGMPLAQRLLRRAGVEAQIVRQWRSMPVPKGTLLVGVGNIKGIAYRMVETLDREGSKT